MRYIVVIGAASSPLLAQSVTDSAGTRVVDYGARLKAAREWNVQPAVGIGGSESTGPTEFADVRGIVRFSDGRIAVANGASGQIRVFDGAGKFLHAVGRRGPGPGEFTRLFGLLRSADSLVGIDGDGRAQVFLATGASVRSLQPLRAELARGSQRVWMLPNGGSLVRAIAEPPRNASSADVATLSVLREPTDGNAAVAIVRVPAYRLYSIGGQRGRRSLDPRAVFAVSASRVCVGHSDRFAVTCHDLAGRPLLRIVRAVKRDAVTEDDRRYVREGYLTANRDAPEHIRRQMQQAVMELPFADLRPAFSRLVLSANGELWVGPFFPGEGFSGALASHAPREPQRWNVFAADGAWLADVTLPASSSRWRWAATMWPVWRWMRMALSASWL